MLFVIHAARQSGKTTLLRDLGLIREDQGTITPSNRIYAEVMARTLSLNLQQRLPTDLINRWTSASGIRMNELLRAFQQFWRENSEAWVQVVGRAAVASAQPVDAPSLGRQPTSD